MQSRFSPTARIYVSRAARGFADGFISLLLITHWTGLNFNPQQMGVIATGTLLGSAALTLSIGLFAHQIGLRRVLLFACALMWSTGVACFFAQRFWPVFIIAVLGTINPSAGDVSIFLPNEQALLGQLLPSTERLGALARYNLAGNLCGALGALASGIPSALTFTDQHGHNYAFLLYAGVGTLIGCLYWGLPRGAAVSTTKPRIGLGRSRAVVLRLSALFCVDSFGGGFVVQSLLALWLFRRFQLSPSTTGSVFFAAGVLAGFSQLLSGRLAKRIGLIPTMVYTHIPANLLLMLAALMPNAGLAITCLLLRMALSQMDVPARQAYVLAVVPAAERAAAATITNVPRSLTAALSPLLTGALLAHTNFGWPLLCAGFLKITYDLLLLSQFRHQPLTEDT